MGGSHSEIHYYEESGLIALAIKPCMKTRQNYYVVKWFGRNLTTIVADLGTNECCSFPLNS